MTDVEFKIIIRTNNILNWIVLICGLSGFVFSLRVGLWISFKLCGSKPILFLDASGVSIFIILFIFILCELLMKKAFKDLFVWIDVVLHNPINSFERFIQRKLLS